MRAGWLERWLDGPPEKTVFWLTLAVYLAFWNPLYFSPMTQVSLDLAWSIAQEHSLALTGRHEADTVRVQGQVMSGVSPGAAFLATPVAWLAGFLAGLDSPVRLTALHMLVSLGIAIPLAAVTAAGLARLIMLQGGTPAPAIASALLFALGTNQFAVALSYSKELVSTAAVVAVLLLLSRPATSRRSALLAGAGAGLLPLLHYTDGVLTAGLALYCWRLAGRQALLWFGLAVAADLGVLAAYHTAAFGSPWLTAYDFPHAPFEFYGSLNSPRDVAYIPFSPFRLGQVLMGPSGFFMGNPIAVLGVIGLWIMARRGQPQQRSLAVFGLTLFALYSVGYTVYRYDGVGGPFLGWRFLHVLLPVLALGFPEAMRTLSRRLVLPLSGYALVLAYLVAQAGYLVVARHPWDKELYMVKIWLTSLGGGVFFTDLLPRLLQAPALHQHFQEVERLAESGKMREALSTLLPLAGTQLLFALVPLLLWGAVASETGRRLRGCCRQEAGVRDEDVRGRLAAVDKQP